MAHHPAPIKPRPEDCTHYGSEQDGFSRCRVCWALYSAAYWAWIASREIGPIRSGKYGGYREAKKADIDAEMALQELKAWRNGHIIR